MLDLRMVLLTSIMKKKIWASAGKESYRALNYLHREFSHTPIMIKAASKPKFKEIKKSEGFFP
jgi:hypothetical protein